MSRYRIEDKKFHIDNYGSEPWYNNWPMLYILENGMQAYIGESNHVATRMEQHKANGGQKADEVIGPADVKHKESELTWILKRAKLVVLFYFSKCVDCV